MIVIDWIFIFLLDVLIELLNKDKIIVLFFENCNSLADLLKYFLHKLCLRVNFNSLYDIFADFDDIYSLCIFYQKKIHSINIFSLTIALELRNFFVINVDDYIFCYINESFLALEDCDLTCFKIVN